MIIINNLAIPVESNRSCIPDLNDCIKFYIKNIFNYPQLGSLRDFLYKCYNELSKGEDSEFKNITFNEAIKKLDKYGFK